MVGWCWAFCFARNEVTVRVVVFGGGGGVGGREKREKKTTTKNEGASCVLSCKLAFGLLVIEIRSSEISFSVRSFESTQKQKTKATGTCSVNIIHTFFRVSSLLI